jgi:hypothetical protein
MGVAPRSLGHGMELRFGGKETAGQAGGLAVSLFSDHIFED